ncbi:unnamed protein product [Paramecium pentaurelia]|uniref:Uncharacterized protein n=1 Tax=Paramecium pentaurelia TaxID=43138 RepID=A0A8S1UVN6_9CILI|nr:unnamed protein product [Paramecium pentaurelia]
MEFIHQQNFYYLFLYKSEWITGLSNNTQNYSKQNSLKYQKKSKNHKSISQKLFIKNKPIEDQNMSLFYSNNLGYILYVYQIKRRFQLSLENNTILKL